MHEATPSTIPPPVQTCEAPGHVPVVTIPKATPVTRVEYAVVGRCIYLGLPLAHELSADEVP